MSAEEVQAARAVTIEELEELFLNMQKRKTCDTNGVVVELLKESGEAMRSAIADVL